MLRVNPGKSGVYPFAAAKHRPSKGDEKRGSGLTPGSLGVDKPAGIDYDSIKSDAKVLKDN